MRGIPILLVFASVAALAIGGIFAQTPPKRPAPKVDFGEMGGGWIKVDQVGDGMSLATKRSALFAVAYHDPSSTYAKTVYRETRAHLVVFNMGAAEYRVRCPSKERAAELIKFLTGEDKDGER